MPAILFASDLHLCDNDPATVAAFFAFLRGPARAAKALYLLGDLFEYWAGDDDDDALTAEIAAALRVLSEHGVALYLMHGNRDFLLGNDYAARCGASLLQDPTLLTVAGRDYLLSHGDALCTDDHTYQQFRQLVRQPDWQASFLARPLVERKAEIARIRQASEQAKREKPLTIMDVNAMAVSKLLASHPGAHLIHGHTHRPARHQHEVQHGLRQRWVLPDWQQGRGGYLALDDDGLRFHGIGQPDHWA